MSKKVTDLEDKEQAALQNDIRRAAIPFMDDEYSEKAYERPKLLEVYGICSTCSQIAFVSTEFRIRLAACEAHHSNVHGEFLLHSGEPVTECTHYNERGRLGLSDMASMAILIEVNPKPAVGFRKQKVKS